MINFKSAVIIRKHAFAMTECRSVSCWLMKFSSILLTVCHLDFYYPLAFSSRVSIKNLLDLSGSGSPLNLTDCIHRCSDVSLSLFLDFSHSPFMLVILHSLPGSAEWHPTEEDGNIFCLDYHYLCCFYFWGEDLRGMCTNDELFSSICNLSLSRG